MKQSDALIVDRSVPEILSNLSTTQNRAAGMTCSKWQKHGAQWIDGVKQKLVKRRMRRSLLMTGPLGALTNSVSKNFEFEHGRRSASSVPDENEADPEPNAEGDEAEPAQDEVERGQDESEEEPSTPPPTEESQSYNRSPAKEKRKRMQQLAEDRQRKKGRHY